PTMSLVWTKDGTPATVTGGEAMSLLQGFNVIVPGYLRGAPGSGGGLDGVAKALADAVNAIHATGVDLYGNDPTQATDSLDFFTGTTAATIKVNPVVAGDPSRIRAGSGANGPLDGTVAQQIAAARHNVHRDY